jgi:cell wall-associated NlpC family hydrolase
MKEIFDTTKYIGIPYTNKGRGMDGADCWGLARLVYKNEFDINLLSFSDEYESSEEGEQIKDVVQKGKDLFKSIEKPCPDYGVI